MFFKYIISSTLFLDRSTGKNKNNTIVKFKLAFVNCGHFKEVTCNFPVRGHSYLLINETLLSQK